MIFELNFITVLIMGLLGGVCSYLANQSIAVFHDGFRPVFPQYFSGHIDRKTLFATSFALSFGLVVGFGLPTSIAGKIILVHTILLATDITGTMFNDDKKGSAFSFLAGAGFGIILLFGMKTIMDIFGKLPIDFTMNLSAVGGLIIISFCVFPSITIAYQCGFKQGVIVFVITMLTKQIIAVYGIFTLLGVKVKLDADGMALLVGIILMVLYAAKDKTNANSSLSDSFAIFEKNIIRIKKNILILSIAGGLVALATTLLIIAEGPASMVFTVDKDYFQAAMVALGRTIGFIPLVMTTAIISGVYSPSGTKLLHVPAILLINAGILGLVGSFFIGALIMALEVVLLGFIAKGMDSFPGMKDLGDHTRTAMSKVMDLALLVGGMIAANEIAPTIGYIWVIGLYFLNQTSKKPISQMAIGPLGAISMGIIVNILHLIGLFPIIAG